MRSTYHEHMTVGTFAPRSAYRMFFVPSVLHIVSDLFWSVLVSTLSVFFDATACVIPVHGSVVVQQYCTAM